MTGISAARHVVVLTVVEINPDETSLTHDATYALRGSGGQVLPALVRAAFKEK